MDDILIYGKTAEEHEERQKKVLKKTAASGLKLNSEKCVFKKTELSYFGHIVGKDGIKPNPDRITRSNLL